MDRVYAYIDDHTERRIALLERLCRQPSISAQGVGLEEMAELTAEAMQEYGLDARVLRREGREGFKAGALAHGLDPIVCVGESLEQNQAGETESFVSSQVRSPRAVAGSGRAGAERR